MDSVSDLQRGDARLRLLTSLQRAVAEDGYRALTGAAIATGAGLPAGSFGVYFESVEDCYLAAFDLRALQLEGIVAAAWTSEREWPLRVRAVIAAALEYFAGSPQLAALLLTEPLAATPAIFRRRQSAQDRLVLRLAEGRGLDRVTVALPEGVEYGLLGSLALYIGREAATLPPDELRALLPGLTQLVLTPYLGLSEAHRISVG
jgi:AcrR family transcriptional regulator